MIELLSAEGFEDYELIDSGNFEKLERFGSRILARPEPQALWSKAESEEFWFNTAHYTFKRDARSPEKGIWHYHRGSEDQGWWINYEVGQLKMKLKLSLSSFKHVGLFPEQAANWGYIYEKCKAIGKAKVLNLFAYTGAASLAARAAGAEVTHVDAIKQVITWANESRTASNIDEIRWIVEDAMKFVKRELRRGNQYNGIILDPPAYGRGPDGEKWVIEDHLNELISLTSQLLIPEQHFYILNLYSLGYSPLLADNLVTEHFKSVKNKMFGELYLKDRAGRSLPLGIYHRFSNV